MKNMYRVCAYLERFFQHVYCCVSVVDNRLSSLQLVSYKQRMLLFWLCVGLLFPAILQAQSYGSPYSVYGIGDLSNSGFTQVSALGGTGIGLRPLNYVNPTNPASYTSIGYPLNSLFDMGFNVSTLKLQNTKSTENLRDGELSHLGLWFRYSPRAAGMFGLVPYSNIGYTVNEEERLVGTAEKYLLTRSGQGGLSKFYFGNAFQLTKNLSLGVNLNYIFGQIEQSETVEDASLTIDNFTIEQDIFLHQASLDLGLQYMMQLGEKNKLTLGATFSKRTALSESGEAQYRDLTDTTRYTDFDFDEYVIPAKYGFGMAFQNTKFSIAADFTHQKWASSDFEDDAALKNSSRFSLGIEWTPNPESLNYLSRMTFRAGGYYQSAYLNVNRKDINEYGFTTGLSLPTQSWGSLNLGYQYSRRGTTLSDLILENKHQFSVGITVKNVWFKKKKIY